MLRGCPHVTVMGIRQCRSNDRPLLLQSCRDDTPCTDDQTIYEHHLSDRLWEHEGRVWIGRCRGGARFIPLQCARPNVLGIQPWSSNDRPPWPQSCRDNIPCTHYQTINEHVSDMLWGHGGQGKSGRRPGEGWGAHRAKVEVHMLRIQIQGERVSFWLSAAPAGLPTLNPIACAGLASGPPVSLRCRGTGKTGRGQPRVGAWCVSRPVLLAVSSRFPLPPPHPP